MKRTNKQDSSDLLDQSRMENNEEMVISREIEGTPFMIVGMLQEKSDNRQWFGALGTIRLTQMMESEEEAIETLSEINWTNIVALVTGLIELNQRHSEEINKLKQVK